MRTVLITAATGGFGPTIAKHLAAKGDRLILHGRNVEKLCRLRHKLHQKENHHICISDPLSSMDAARDIEEFLLSSDLIPNILIHHLGGTLGVRSALSSPEDWLSVLRLNVLFGAEINSLLVPKMKASKSPSRIIHISSISAISLRGSAPYAASKAFLNAYITTLARELAQTEIVVSGIMPGAVVTPGSNWSTYKRDNPGIVADFLRHHHGCGRLGRPDEILPAVDFLSDFNNTFAQGCIVNIDGATM